MMVLWCYHVQKRGPLEMGECSRAAGGGGGGGVSCDVKGRRGIMFC